MSSTPQFQPSQPSGNQPFGGQPSGNQPFGGQQFGNQQYGGQQFGMQPSNPNAGVVRILAIVMAALSLLGLLYQVISMISGFISGAVSTDAASTDVTGASVASGLIGLLFGGISILVFVLAIIVAIMGRGRTRTGAIICGALLPVNLIVSFVAGMIIGIIVASSASSGGGVALGIVALIGGLLVLLIKTVGTVAAIISAKSAHEAVRAGSL
ncbi:hypothetical protein [Helcobacillus massiliensis]|uniref:hypothetical protein n=1 Tax=Helcobacillus massiliensis TaxID=521392 RepID=UPI002557BF11|nr:hypothetical protein [Helcobacillus massiliensis]MDK7742669.1 hypothetical protein [Helcobacillus massiliensis]WOO93048.1 hypothetical protein R3I40_00175 [Helcobacillus massiliensis]